MATGLKRDLPHITLFPERFMKKVSVDLYTDQGNGAVLKLPNRQYPGVLIQGDTLQTYITDLCEILDECKKLHGSSDVCEDLADFINRLVDLRSRYENAINSGDH